MKAERKCWHTAGSMVADTSLQSCQCRLAEPQSTPADDEKREQPRRRTGKARKRKIEERGNLSAEPRPSTSGRPSPERGASSARHEIDVLFAPKPPKAPAPPQQSAKKALLQQSARKAKALGSKDDLFGTRTAKARRGLRAPWLPALGGTGRNSLPVPFALTAAWKGRRRLDGLPVYSADELRVDQGGGTPECPFDCDCCF